MTSHTFHRLLLSFLFFSVAFVGFNAQLRAETYTVEKIGDWTNTPDDSLAKALQELVAGSNHTINLGTSWATNVNTSDWSDWESSDGYKLFQPTATLATGQTITVVLNGNTISGTPLELVTGLGKYTFSDGTLGDAASNFRIGVTGDAEVTFGSMTLLADVLQIGSATTDGKATFNGSEITVNLFSASGYGTEITLNGSSTLTTNSTGNLELSLGAELTSTSTGALLIGGNANLLSGGRFSATGPVSISGNLSVGQAGVFSLDTDPVTYLNVQSEFKASGNLSIDGNAISAIKGGKIDLTGAKFGGVAGTPWAIGNGKSITVSGIHSHKESIKSFASELIWNGTDLNVSGTGVVKVAGGGIFSNVGAISVTSGGSFTVDGALLDSDTGKNYRSTVHADGILTVDNTTFNVENGALVDGLTDIVVNNGGTLNILKADAVSGYDSTISAGGTLTLGGATIGTLNMTDGGKLKGITDMVIGGSAQAVVDLSGIGSGNARTIFSATGTLTVGNADIDIKSGALWNTTGAAALATTAGNLVTLDIGARAGSGDGFDASFATGNMILADQGTVRVNIATGGSMSTGDTILAKETGSVAEVTINETYRPGEHRAWVVNGSETDPGFSKGQSFLNVTSGMVDVKGFLSMGSQNYTGNYGNATFAGTNAELHMGGGSFRNQGDGAGSTIGMITIGNGGIVSGSGDIIAGELFKVDGGLITPGGRWMYNFERNNGDNLTCLGKLSIWDDANVTTLFQNATFQTQLDRETAANDVDFTNGFQESDRVVVRGKLIVDNVNVNISRVLSGDYVLIKAEDGIKKADGTTDYAGFDLNTLVDDSVLLNLNGKPITQNDRIDRANGMYTTYDAASKEIRLHVETLTGGNVITHWTGEGTTWDMVSKNFEAAPTGGTKQFLDGDIVIFHGEWMDSNGAAGGSRIVDITSDTKYKGNVIVPEVRVLGAQNFTWNGAGPGSDTNQGSIIAYDSALYTTLTQGSSYIDPATGAEVKTPSGELQKVGSGILTINNANEFYGGIHLGVENGDASDPEQGGGKVVLNNEKGFGSYNSMSGFQERGLVYVHQNTVIDVSSIGSITNRFLVDPERVLTFIIGGTFEISDNNALSGNAIEDGKGGGIYIGNKGSVVYSGSGGLKLTNNQASMGGGIYTELGYMLDVPADISGNYAQSGGGGIYAEKYFEMKDASTISENTTNKAGGGIYVGNVGSLGSDSPQFILHGNTIVKNNKSGGETGGGMYVEAGREVVLSTKKETKSGTNFSGGDIWFENNYAKVEFNPDNPRQAVTSPDQIRNAIHLSRIASTAGTFDGATLDISGPYNVYFYDPVSGDTGTEITIRGVQADTTNVNPIYDNNDPPNIIGHDILPNTQFGTVVFHDDSIFFGDTNVISGATFRLEENSDGVEAVFGRRGSLAISTPTDNTFTVDADSSVTGQGTIAADTITLAGKINLDTGTFSRPGLRDGSGAINGSDTATQGVLKLDGTVELAATSLWKLNLTGGNGSSTDSDLIDVTGAATFKGNTAGQKLTLDIDDIVRGKYEIMKTTGGIVNFNTETWKSDARVYLNGDTTLDYAQSNPPGSVTELGRLKVTTYADSKTKKNLYLDVKGRNRHVKLTLDSNWGYNDSWTFDTSYIPSGTGFIAGLWTKNDSGPATDVYLDGDMVTIDGAAANTVTLQSAVRPVDLFVTGASGQNVTISGGFGITTFTTGASADGVYGNDKTTITTVKANNDYGIEGYTGKLYKDGISVLKFNNNAANQFTEGIVLGNAGTDAGTIEFDRVNQLTVGAGKTIDFKNDGILKYLGTGSETLATSTGEGTNINVFTGMKTTFDINSNTGILIVSGLISNGGSMTTGKIVKNGNGTLNLTAQNLFSGGTTFNDGTLHIGHQGSFKPAVGINTALGLYDTATSSAGKIFVEGGSSKTFKTGGSYKIKNRFIVAGTASNQLKIEIAAGKTLTIDGVVTGTTENGGAISVAAGASQLAFTGTGNLTMTGNKAQAGGAIHSAVNTDLTFTGATTFTGNEARNGSGGAIHAAGDVTFNNGSNTVNIGGATGNTATDAGGGIYSGGTVTLGGTGTKTIAKNSVTGNNSKGGAIYAQNISLIGPATISGNTANASSGRGGAFYIEDAANLASAGKLTLDTGTGTTGNITFSGNTASLGQAVYLGEYGNIDVIAQNNGTTLHTVQFDDSLVTETTTDHTLTKTGSGTLAFTGPATGDCNNNIFRGDTKVVDGTFRITGGTSYGYAGTGTFTLNQITPNVWSNGAFLTGGGTLTAETFHLKGIVAPDSGTGVGEITDATDSKRFGTLNFNGDVNMYGDTSNLSYQYDAHLGASTAWNVQGNSDLLKVNGIFNANTSKGKIIINLHNFGIGKFLLIEADSLVINDGSGSQDVNGIDALGAFDVTIHDFLKTDRHKATFLRGSDTFSDGVATPEVIGTGTKKENQLWIATQFYNLHMYWSGLEPVDGVRTWDGVDDETNANWNDKAGNGGETQFVNRDSVVFGETAPNWNGSGTDIINVATGATRTVTINPLGVTVTNMLVDNTDATGHEYKFLGTGGITTANDFAGNILETGQGYTHGSAPQTLTKQNAGSLIFANTADNLFSGGILIGNAAGNAGGTIAFTRGGHLAVGADKAITFRGNGTLQADANNQTVTGNIVVNSGKTASIYTKGNTLTLSGKITGDALTKSLPTSGTANGVLILNNTTNDYTGTTTIQTGTLRAHGGADLATALGENAAGTSHHVDIENGAELELQVASAVLSTLNQQIRQSVGTGGKVEKIGAGTQTLTHANNTYTGGTTVTEGTLVAKHAKVDATHLGSIGTGNAILSDGTVLQFDIQESGVFEAAINRAVAGSGTGQIIKSKAGTTLTLGAADGTTASNFTGTVTVKDGTAGNTSKILAKNASVLNGAATTDIILSGLYDHLEIEQITNGSLARRITGAGHFIKSGSTNLTLSGTNTFTGGTTLSNGGLTLTNASALGSYNNSIASSGRVTVTGASTTTFATTGTPTYRNHFDVNGGLAWTLNVTETGTLGGFTNAGNGGAITLNAGSTATVNVSDSKTLTFSGNKENTNNSNDIYMNSASLNVNGAGNTLIGGGIRGGGTVTKSGNGILQIGANSVFTGQTNVTGGTFRVLENVHYGDATATGFSQTNGHITGNGTIQSAAVTITGNLRPDSATGTTPTATENDRFGTLTLSGTSINLGNASTGFTMDYDMPVSAGSYGDLLKTNGSTTLYGGNINFVATQLNSGKYLIIDSNQAITINGTPTKKLDGISDPTNGVLTATLNGKALTNNTPRYSLQFYFDDIANEAANSEIWLDVERNTLEQNWTNTSATATWDTTSDNWQSKQWNTTDFEKKFNNGDYVNFTGNHASGQTISVADNVVVSGMTVDGTNNITFSGNGITGRKQIANDTVITGKFVDASNPVYVPSVVPDGKLTKKGSGILTLNNANSFEQGTELNAGKIVLGNTAALGTYVYSSSSAEGVVNVTGTSTLELNTSGTIKNRFNVSSGTFDFVNTTGRTNTIGGMASALNGGAVSLASGTVMNLNNAGSLTFSGNSENGNTSQKNDFYLDSASLHFKGVGNTFLNGGIRGSGTITKTDGGITQIGETSLFNGSTTISAGNFRVVTAKTFGGTGSFSLANGAALSGQGIVQAGTIAISGTIDPDAKVFTASDTTTPTGDDRFATLTLTGNVNLAASFKMQYDAKQPNDSISPTGDLLVVNGGTMTINKGGTINLRNSTNTLTGSYHIIDASQAITLVGGSDINDILTATINGATLDNYSVRGGYDFKMRDTNKEVWLDVRHNSLNMVWQDQATNSVWSASGNNEYWLSKQGGAAPEQKKEKVFNNGDYIHFTGSTDQEIMISGQVDVAGFEFNSTKDYIFKGDTNAKIHAANNLSSTEGAFKGVSLIPDGKLNKNGSGVLAFQNRGGNTFAQGIEITAGTIAFTQADQLGDGGNGITFLGDGVLRADATGQNLGNKIIINTGKTATINTKTNDLTISGIISGNALQKDGNGRLTLSGVNTYTGLTTVAGGTLEAIGVAALGQNNPTNQVAIANNAELETKIVSGSQTLNKLLVGAGSFEKTGSGTLIISQDDNTYSGNTTVTAGKLTAQHAEVGAKKGSLGIGSASIASGAVLDFNILEDGTFSKQISGAGKLEKDGSKILTLTNSTSSYTGGTEIKGGRITALHENTLGGNLATGTVLMSGTGSSLEFKLTASGTFKQKITGVGELIQTGPSALTLSNANTFAGGTQWNGGNITLTDGAGLSATNGSAGKSGFVYVNNGGILTTVDGANTLKNRFEVAGGKLLTFASPTAGTTISGNDVRGVNGGAIELKIGAGFTSSVPLYLTNNTTDGNGGAVYAPTEHITVGGTGQNTIAALNGNSAVHGGGVYAKSVTVKGLGTGTVISGNTASGDGGAFYLVGGATSILDATNASITLQGNTSSAGANAIYMNQNVRLEMTGNHTINLYDGITSTFGSANGNLVDISMSTVEDMRQRAVNVYGKSNYYGNTDFNSGLVILHDNSRFGEIASDNQFVQKTNATLAGSGTISAKNILLGGTINAGIYTPPPREADIDTLHFSGSTNIGELSIGQTRFNIDIDSHKTQTADLMNITGGLNIAGDSLVDFNTFSAGKYLVVKTSNGVTGHTQDGYFGTEKKIADFESTVAGYTLNPNRFEIVYTLENGDQDIYVNMTLHNEYLIWTGANAYVQPFSDEVSYVGNDEYRNDWLNERLYNWHQAKDGVSRDARFRQGDKVAFVGNDAKETAQPNYQTRRENIEIVTFNEDDDTTSGVTIAHVGDMVVTGGGTYRFTGRGIEASIDPYLPISEDVAGQLWINGNATAIFTNGANNFQRGIVLQNGSVAFNNADQLGTVFKDDNYNGGVTASHGITVDGKNSYGKLIANADNMTLGIVINVKDTDSEIVIDTNGNDFGDSSVTGNYTLTLKHADIDGHTAPALGTPTPINGIYGKGRLVKSGTGTLILADENYYEGGTVIEEGTLAAAADNRLGKTGTFIVLGKTSTLGSQTNGTFRALESFETNRSIVLGHCGGVVEADADKTLTLSGILTDYNTTTGIGSLNKTGLGTVMATNAGNNFRRNLNVDAGRFVAVGLETLGDEDPSRILSTKNNNGVRSVLELQVSGNQTLRQQLNGDGEVVKSGNGTLNLTDDNLNFAGLLNVASGSIHLTGKYENTDSFRFQNGTILTGFGLLGAKGTVGGVFESGSILKPSNVLANDPTVSPSSKSISITGSVTFDAGSMYQVVITQYPDASYDPANPERMRPVSDCLSVKDGTVTIKSGAVLDVELDYWADELIPFDFGEDTSGHWTIINASNNGSANSQYEHFELAEVELPRGVEMEHGWNGSLYQLWLVGNPTGAFTEIADSHNTKEVGTVLEELVADKDPGTKDLIKILSQKDLDDETIVDVMRQMAGDLRADSMVMALKMPWRQPFNRLDRDMFPYVQDPCEPVSCRKRHHYEREFWGEAYGRYGDTRSDGNAFSNRISRAGTVIGIDKQINMYSLFGIAFNYSEPRMKQRTGIAELEDFEIGLYNLTKVLGNYDVKTYLGYSHQRYDFQRHVYISKGNRYDTVYESFKNKTSGDGFAMSVELLRSFRYNKYVKLSPLLALDYEKVWQRGYEETPVTGSTAMTALRHDNSSLERLMIRIGLNIKAEVRDRLDLFGRIQYATQLNRTEYARSNSYFVAATDPSVMDIHGVAAGRDYLNLGIGAEYYFKGRKRATSIYVNYDADFWKRQTTHTGNLGFVHRW